MVGIRIGIRAAQEYSHPHVAIGNDHVRKTYGGAIGGEASYPISVVTVIGDDGVTNSNCVSNLACEVWKAEDVKVTSWACAAAVAFAVLIIWWHGCLSGMMGWRWLKSASSGRPGGSIWTIGTLGGAGSGDG